MHSRSGTDHGGAKTASDHQSGSTRRSHSDKSGHPDTIGVICSEPTPSGGLVRSYDVLPLASFGDLDSSAVQLSFPYRGRSSGRTAGLSSTPLQKTYFTCQTTIPSCTPSSSMLCWAPLSPRALLLPRSEPHQPGSPIRSSLTMRVGLHSQRSRQRDPCFHVYRSILPPDAQLRFGDSDPRTPREQLLLWGLGPI